MEEREYLQKQYEERTVIKPIDKAVSEIAELKKSIGILKIKQMEILSKLDLLIVAQKDFKKGKPETSSGGWIFS